MIWTRFAAAAPDLSGLFTQGVLDRLRFAEMMGELDLSSERSSAAARAIAFRHGQVPHVVTSDERAA